MEGETQTPRQEEQVPGQEGQVPENLEAQQIPVPEAPKAEKIEKPFDYEAEKDAVELNYNERHKKVVDLVNEAVLGMGIDIGTFWQKYDKAMIPSKKREHTVEEKTIIEMVNKLHEKSMKVAADFKEQMAVIDARKKQVDNVKGPAQEVSEREQPKKDAGEEETPEKKSKKQLFAEIDSI